MNIDELLAEVSDKKPCQGHVFGPKNVCLIRGCDATMEEDQ